MSGPRPRASILPARTDEGRMTVTLHVCITCRAGEPANDAMLPMGGQLHQALDALERHIDAWIASQKAG